MGVVTKMMMIRQVLLALVVFSVSSKRSPKIGLKGAAPSACGCQCSDLVWQDKYGTVHGNCRSADHTKAKWCYVKEGSTCSDLVPSARHPRNPWSYQACATPIQRRCGGSSSGFSSNLGGNGRGQAGGFGSGGSQFNSGSSNDVLAGTLYGGQNSGNRPSGQNQGGSFGQGSGHSSGFGSSHGSNGGFTGNQGGSGFSNGGQSSGFGGGSHSSQGQFSSAFGGSSGQKFTGGVNGGQGFGGQQG